jgi:hypothetical protein
MSDKLPWTEEERAQFARIPVQMSMTEHKEYITWSRWADFFKGMPFNAKKGGSDQVMTIRATPSPITSQVHRPKRFLQQPLVDEHMPREKALMGYTYRHRYVSPYIHWEPSYADFRDGQVMHATKDIARQIAMKNEFFIRDQVIGHAPHVYIAGKGLVTGVPAGAPSADDPIKDADFWKNLIEQIPAGDAGHLNFRTLLRIRDMLENDLNTPHWEGGLSAPSDNEVLKGKYLLMGGGAIYSNLQYDNSVLTNRPLAMDLINSRFKGVIGSNVVFRAERFDTRFLVADGTQPAPEIELQEPGLTYGPTHNLEPIGNPDYLNSPVRLAILIGYAPAKALDVGPPPKEFAGKSGINGKKFAGLNWNGQVEATQNVLINYPDDKVETNKWGDVIQLLAQTAHGFLPEHPRFILPILYRANLAAAENI